MTMTFFNSTYSKFFLFFLAFFPEKRGIGDRYEVNPLAGQENLIPENTEGFGGE